ncbi:type-F conjugative transfer system protein TrbI [Sphingomonas sp. HH69]
MTDTIETPVAGIPADATQPAAEAVVAPTAKRIVFAGYTAPQLVLGVALIAVLIWGMWVTRAITAPPQRIVKANLSGIVGDYVQAQARSATPPDQVQEQMRAFMTSLDTELQRRGADGQVVLVGEAVLSKSVPDITPDVLTAVYASGVKRPLPATPQQMNQMLQGGVPGPIPQVPATAPAPAPAQVSAGENPFAPAPAAGGPAFDPAMAGASVSSFGGPNGAGGQ